jgi:LPXTG-motif cell wall-anchored protein
MKKSMKIAAAVAIVAMMGVAASPALAVPPAAPRSLPAGEALYVFFGCSSDTDVPAVGSVDVATGAVTEIVPFITTDQCYSQPAYNPVDGLIYVIDWTLYPATELAVFDPAAKTLTKAANIDCNAYMVAIDPSGNAWVWDYDTGDVRPFSLTTGHCGTAVGSTGPDDTYFAMAYAPDGVLYATNYSTGEFGTLSTIDGTFTPIAGSAMGVDDNAGMTFDSSGTMWVLDEVNLAEVYSADINDYSDTSVRQGQLSFNGTDYYSEALVVGPAQSVPALPNTGSDSVAIGIVGLTALFALGAGVTFVARRRRAS